MWQWPFASRSAGGSDQQRLDPHVCGRLSARLMPGWRAHDRERNVLCFQTTRRSCDVQCAFSRDQEHKIYVQHRMQENAAELWRWIDAGAYFYVCGDALKMAKDVDAALRMIVQEQSGRSAEEANAYVEQMKADKRYKRDVY